MGAKVGGRPYAPGRSFKCFWPAFDPPTGGGVGSYLVLLNLGDGAADSVGGVRRCVERCRSAEPQIIHMLGDTGWRTNLVGAVAAMVRDPTPGVTEAIWERLRQGSWVAPQLAVAVAEVDGDFDQRAVIELEQLADAPTGWASKSAAALDALVGGPRTAAIRDLVDADEEGGASIALRWRHDFRRAKESGPLA